MQGLLQGTLHKLTFLELLGKYLAMKGLCNVESLKLYQSFVK